MLYGSIHLGCTHICTCVCVHTPEVTLGYSPSYFLRQSFSLNLKRIHLQTGHTLTPPGSQTHTYTNVLGILHGFWDVNSSPAFEANLSLLPSPAGGNFVAIPFYQ